MHHEPWLARQSILMYKYAATHVGPVDFQLIFHVDIQWLHIVKTNRAIVRLAYNNGLRVKGKQMYCENRL